MTDTTGEKDVVRLPRTQFWSIIGACILPAVAGTATVVNFNWAQSDRLLKLETMCEYLVDSHRTQQAQINRMATNEATLQRMDQRLIEIERRLGQIEGHDQRQSARTP